MPSWVDILTGGDASVTLFRDWEDMEVCMEKDWETSSICEMMRVELELGYRLIPEPILDGKTVPLFLLLMINNEGGSPIFGRVLDLAQRATPQELDNFFDRLSPKSSLMEAYIAKQRSKLHVIVRFQDLSSEGDLAYYLSDKRHILFGKRQITSRSQ